MAETLSFIVSFVERTAFKVALPTFFALIVTFPFDSVKSKIEASLTDQFTLGFTVAFSGSYVILNVTVFPISNFDKLISFSF